MRDAQRAFLDLADARPDPYIRKKHASLLDTSRAAVAQLLHVPRDECVFVKNATTGVATVLYNLNFQPGEALVYFEPVYGAVEKGIVSLQEHSALQSRKVSFEYPITEDELERRFREVVRRTREEGLKVRAAVFDTIVSLPGVRFPFERFTALCREEGILSVIDGAHGIGQIPLDLSVLRPDFLVSNCHKYVHSTIIATQNTKKKRNKRKRHAYSISRWLYTPRSLAVLYVPKQNQSLIRTTLPTSWGFIPDPSSTTGTAAPSILQDANAPKTKTAFEELFEFVATTDDSAYTCVPAALQFRTDVCGGEESLMAYCRDLANEAAEMVAAALGTEVLQEPDLKPGEQSRIRQCAMTTVRLPIAVAAAVAVEQPVEGAATTVEGEEEVLRVVGWMQGQLMERYGTFVPVFRHGRWLWTRLSAQTYLEKSDFEWLAGVLRELCDRVVRKEYKEGLS